MKENITYIYNYLNYKPQVGILSAICSYIIAIKTLVLTDEALKVIGTVSTCAGCVVACLSALSMLIKSFNFLFKLYKLKK